MAKQKKQKKQPKLVTKKYDKVVDSGKKKTFSTGAKRDIQSGKGRYDLIPMYSLSRLADHYENGATKYADRNWEKGIPLHRYLDSAMRHLAKYSMGYRDEDHLAAVAWNVFGLMYTELMIAKGLLPKSLLENMPIDQTV